VKRYLLADDDPDDRELFDDALKAIDPSIECYLAVDGSEVIQKLTTGEVHPPDAIFLDINMPQVNGRQCLHWLKKNDAFRNIPVIMYSTSTSRSNQTIAADFGAVGFFEKPMEFAGLVKVLSVVIAKPALGLNDIDTYFRPL
jgi:CheY-like chemotaxis protein